MRKTWFIRIIVCRVRGFKVEALRNHFVKTAPEPKGGNRMEDQQDPYARITHVVPEELGDRIPRRGHAAEGVRLFGI
jgi:hypothetical protein